MRAAAKFLAKVVGEAADIGTLGAGHAAFCEGFGIFRDPEIVNMDQARFARYFHAFAREFIERHAVFFDG